jgi:CRP/FNR family transcriptional regulator, cyclic AMP receptor protein
LGHSARPPRGERIGVHVAQGASDNRTRQAPGATVRPALRGITPSLLADAVRSGHLCRSSLLKGLHPDDLAMILADARWKRLERGSTLTLHGSRSAHAWLLVYGFVKEHRPLPDGTDAVCAFRGPGDLVGELGALTGCPADNEATLLTPGEALSVSGEALARAARMSERLQHAVLRAVASRAIEAEAAVARQGQVDAMERVAMAVLSLGERWGVPVGNGILIRLPLTQAELASWVGVSRETAAKALAHLRRAGLVSTSRRRLIVHDLDGLRRASGEIWSVDRAWVRSGVA